MEVTIAHYLWSQEWIQGNLQGLSGVIPLAPALTTHSLKNTSTFPYLASSKSKVWVWDESWPTGHKGVFSGEIWKQIIQIKKGYTSLPLLQQAFIMSICDLWSHHTQAATVRKQLSTKSIYAKEKDGRCLGPGCQWLLQTLNCSTQLYSCVR